MLREIHSNVGCCSIETCAALVRAVKSSRSLAEPATGREARLHGHPQNDEPVCLTGSLAPSEPGFCVGSGECSHVCLGRWYERICGGCHKYEPLLICPQLPKPPSLQSKARSPTVVASRTANTLAPYASYSYSSICARYTSTVLVIIPRPTWKAK